MQASVILIMIKIKTSLKGHLLTSVMRHTSI